jgi:hypothetical protein
LRGPVGAHNLRTMGGQRWLAVILPILIGTTAGPALGQAQVPEQKTKNRAPAKAVRARRADAPEVKVTKSTPGPTRTRQPGRRVSAKPMPNPVGPQPKWVLESNEIELEPMWHGGTVQCVFKIRNEGEGDLSIRARGG